MIKMCSGITRGRVLNGVRYAQRFHKLIYLHLFTDCFMKNSPQSSEQIQQTREYKKGNKRRENKRRAHEMALWKDT